MAWTGIRHGSRWWGASRRSRAGGSAGPGRAPAEVLEARRLPATITVTSTADTVRSQTGITLREAIELANRTIPLSDLANQAGTHGKVVGKLSTPNTIAFDVPGAGPHTIVLNSPLPTITSPVVIDGYTEPGAAANTATASDDAKIQVVLSQGQAFVTPPDLLNTDDAPVFIDTNGTTVRGLAFVNFETAGPLITLDGTAHTAAAATPNTLPTPATVGASGDVVAGNFIGLGPAGGAAPGRTAEGVLVTGGASGNTIGGSSPAARNVVVLNDTSPTLKAGPGVAAVDVASGTGNVVAGNFIGVDASGVVKGSALVSGVEVDAAAAATTIGGGAGAGNVIAGAGSATLPLDPGSGVVIAGTGTTVQGNLIGVGADGVTPAPNASNGVLVEAGATNTVIGATAGATDAQATAEANVIADNANDGVLVQGAQGTTPAASGTTVRANSVSGNAHLGIELQPGVAPGLAPPVLGNPAVSGGTTTVPVSATAPAGDSVVVDVFSNPGRDPSGTGQGKTFLGSLTLKPGAPAAPLTGNFVTAGDLTTNGQVVSATATDPTTGNTSAFSADVPPGGTLQPTTLALTAVPPGPANGMLFTFTAVVSPTTTAKGGATPTGLVSFTVDGVAQNPQPVTVVNGVAEATSAPVALVSGANTVTAVYSGDATFAPSPTATLTETLAPTSVNLSVSPTSPAAGKPVVVSASLTLPAGVTAAPTGLLTIAVDGKAVATAVPSPGGVSATLNLAGGSHAVTASYSGDPVYAPSAAAAVTVTVSPIATATTLTASAAEIPAGLPVTLTAGVSVAGGARPPAAPPSGDPAFAGAVTFRAGSTVLATVPVNPVGVAALTTSALAAGPNAVTAVYVNDPNYATSTSAALGVTVNPPIDGPRVVAVQRFGFHESPTTLIVAFNGPLNPATAQNVYNYRITDPSGGTVLVQSAVYSATTDTVTLQTVLSLDIRTRYTLTIFGVGLSGVKGATGTLLDGAGTGQGGSNFVAPLDASALVVTDPTAPGAGSAAAIAARARKADARHPHPHPHPQPHASPRGHTARDFGRR